MNVRVFLLCYFLLGAIALPSANATPPDKWSESGHNPVPQGAKVTLTFDRPEYLLGENVLLHFLLENTGKDPIQGEMGGDYRGCDRHLRFKVTATDDQAKEAASPDPEPMCLGGLGGSITVKPGEKISFCIPLMRYCQIDRPGRYTILATHDFGWKDGDRKSPVGETTITFRMPTPDEAAQVVAKMEKLSDDQSPNLFGQSDGFADFADFRCLRYPVYLKILQPLAQAGDLRALEAIGTLPSTAATQGLIDLANNPDPKQSLAAALMLNRRLPDPEFEGKLNPRSPFNLYRTAQRQKLAKESWNARFTGPVRDLAKNFLNRKDDESVSGGAFMIQAVGTLDDARPVFQALDRALESMTDRHDLKVDTLDYPAPIPELVRAVKMLQDRGYDSTHPSGDGQIMGYFLSFAGQPGPRPPDWRQNLDASGQGGRYPVRQAALESIPDVLPDDCVEFINRGLLDEDYGVCRVACTLAGKSGRKEFLKPLLEIIATENEEWLMSAASDSATQLGGGYDLWEAWSDRLVDEKLYPIALDSLQTVLEGLPGGCGGRTDLSRSERIALRDAWKKFLAAHEVELRHGKKFKYTDPAVSTALFGRARDWDMPDGTTWPKPREK